MILVAFSSPCSRPQCIIPTKEKPETTQKTFLHKICLLKMKIKWLNRWKEPSLQPCEPEIAGQWEHSRLWWLGSWDPRCQGKEALAAGAPGAGHLSCWERTPLYGPEGQERHLPAWISCPRCQCPSSTGIKQRTGQAGEAGTALLLLAQFS